MSEVFLRGNGRPYFRGATMVARRSLDWQRGFAARWLEGADYAALATEFNITPDLAANWRRRLRLPVRPLPVLYPEETIVLAVKMHDEGGLPWRVVARELGYARDALKNAVLKRRTNRERTGRRPVGSNQYTVLQEPDMTPVPVVASAYACPRCGGRSLEPGGHGICAMLPVCNGVDRRDVA